MNDDSEILKAAKILIIDDEKANVRYLEIIFQEAGYNNVRSTTDPREALPLYLETQPDVVLLDLNMPYLDGFAVMAQIRGRGTGESYLPILVLTADISRQAKQRALTEGANDFLSKPLDSIEVLLRTNTLLRTRFQNSLLEEQVYDRTRKLEVAQLETLQRLAVAAEYRDDETGLHTRRVGLTSARIAENIGLPNGQVELIEYCAPLHDVGKIGIPDSILLKPGKLTEHEFATMKRHTIIGSKILSESGSPWIQMAKEIALTHHERWDGSGYPVGIEGDSIPLVGRIVAIADVFDALTHERPYKSAWSVIQAAAEIESHSGKQFDSQLVGVFLKLLDANLIGGSISPPDWHETFAAKQYP